MHKAFVLMPFDPEFDNVYSLFIADALSDAGFEVSRADDIRSQQNILKDIISGIAQSDLIVADLTGLNPNVFYELGLAHCLNRPVILLSQDVSELPFDLRSYRVVAYDTDFAQIPKAKEELIELAVQARKGALPFGNPITDFGAGSPFELSKGTQQTTSLEPARGDEDLGFLDHAIRMEDGLNGITQILNEIGSETKAIGEETGESTKQVELALKNPSSGTTRYLQKSARKLGQKYAAYVSFLAAKNASYRNGLRGTADSLEYVIGRQKASTDEERKQLRELADSLEQAEKGCQTGREGAVGFLDTMKSLPNIERTFERARQSAVREIQRLIDNIDQTVAMISRATLKVNAVLQSTSSDN